MSLPRASSSPSWTTLTLSAIETGTIAAKKSPYTKSPKPEHPTHIHHMILFTVWFVIYYDLGLWYSCVLLLDEIKHYSQQSTCICTHPEMLQAFTHPAVLWDGAWGPIEIRTKHVLWHESDTFLTELGLGASMGCTITPCQQVWAEPAQRGHCMDAPSITKLRIPCNKISQGWGSRETGMWEQGWPPWWYLLSGGLMGEFTASQCKTNGVVLYVT